ncbi:hypothetical protein [Pseudoalteromonas maricaloris]|uniref:hypothetical protein n=1 Tax=Pseudoalteromonas maricaloris TaxID=184924 RepID=UPI003C1758BB
MLIKRCPLGSSECALFIVAQLLPRLLGCKSSVATKTHSEEQKSNSKGQQALVYLYKRRQELRRKTMSVARR